MPQPRLLIIAPTHRAGEEYAMRLGLPSRSTFDIITPARPDRLQGLRDQIFRICTWWSNAKGFKPGFWEELAYMEKTERLRLAKDEDITSIIETWNLGEKD